MDDDVIYREPQSIKVILLKMFVVDAIFKEGFLEEPKKDTGLLELPGGKP